MTVAPTLRHPIVLTAEEIASLPDDRLTDIGTGVHTRVLWESGDALVGVMRIDSEGKVDDHAHQQAFHDTWVVEGSCELLGRWLTAGSYAHVPAGIAHDTIAGPGGCTLLYLYRRS
jgi:hypothetical protein